MQWRPLQSLYTILQSLQSQPIILHHLQSLYIFLLPLPYQCMVLQLQLQLQLLLHTSLCRTMVQQERS